MRRSVTVKSCFADDEFDFRITLFGLEIPDESVSPSRKVRRTLHFAECACEAIRAGDHYRAYSYFRALDIGNEFVSASIASAIQRIREQIIRSMMSDPVWSARMKSRSAGL